eukprot:755716-Hanusia_phi.AAC.4
MRGHDGSRRVTLGRPERPLPECQVSPGVINDPGSYPVLKASIEIPPVGYPILNDHPIAILEKYPTHFLFLRIAMVDSVARWAQGAITEAGETVGEAIIGGAGALFMPFVTPLEEFEPVQEYKEDKGTSVDPNKMTPQMMRKEKDLLNKQLREAAFMGVCHLPVQYAGKKKQIDDDTYRLNKRLEDLKKEFTKKYPPGSFVDLGKGRFRILPVYKGNGGAGVLSKLKVEMPQALKQMFLKTEPPPKTGDAPTGEARPLVVVSLADASSSHSSRVYRTPNLLK